MKLISLCSGGKDGAYALWLAKKKGHKIVRLLTMIPEARDSWMFHKPEKKLIKYFSEAADLPITIGNTKGTKNQELEDLKHYLENTPAEGVVSGTVASNYQKERIEKICSEIGLESITPLWKKDSSKLMEGMLKDNFKIIISSVSAGGLTERWIGRRIDQNCLEELKKQHEKHGIHLMGEGGEYETLVLDAPYFKKRIKLKRTEKVWRRDRGHLAVKDAKLVEK